MDIPRFDTGTLPPLAIASQLNDALAKLPDVLMNEPLLRAGMTLGELRGIDAGGYEGLYAAAGELCDAEAFQDALPIALQLAAHEPRDARFTFMAASCLQRLGHHREATSMYGLCMLARNHPMAAYRAGECLVALGETEAARDAFDVAHQMCQGDERHRGLQDWCAKATSRLAS